MTLRQIINNRLRISVSQTEYEIVTRNSAVQSDSLKASLTNSNSNPYNRSLINKTFGQDDTKTIGEMGNETDKQSDKWRV